LVSFTRDLRVSPTGEEVFGFPFGSDAHAMPRLHWISTYTTLHFDDEMHGFVPSPFGMDGGQRFGWIHYHLDLSSGKKDLDARLGRNAKRATSLTWEMDFGLLRPDTRDLYMDTNDG
jgi:hypothetical protein